MLFRYRDLTVHYTERGEGAPVLLLHGWMGSADSFLPLIADFSRARRVIAPDFPGQGGQTPAPGEAYDVAEHARLVLALMDALDVQRASIVAHSFGGRVALKLASEHPERVDKMVLTGGAGLRPKNSAKRRARSLAYRALRALIDGPLFGPADRERARAKLRGRFGSADYKALEPSMRATFNRVVAEDLSPCLPKISAPTILIYGTEDRETPVWMGEKMAREMRDAALITFPGAGHFAYLDEYARFYAITAQFLGI
jgi:pimeloyl-ACP methyl ester carboxylesterase